MQDHLQRRLCCYRLDYRSAYDEELVWSIVQRYGGYIGICPSYIDFWLAPEWSVVLVLSFPDLERRPELDYL